MRTGRVPFVHAGAWTGQFVRARARVACDVQSSPVIDPVNQPVAKYRIRSRDAMGKRNRVAHFARGVRVRNIDDANAVSVPPVEHEILEHRWIVILLCDIAPALAVWLRVGLVEAIVKASLTANACEG